MAARRVFRSPPAGREEGPGVCHGLGYARWEYESVGHQARALRGGEELGVEVRLRNTGMRSSREVVHVYIEGPDDDVRRPVRALAGFARRFDEASRAWVVHAGTYRVRVGRSSRDLRLAEEVVVTR